MKSEELNSFVDMEEMFYARRPIPSLLFIVIPLALSTFTHLWNPAGFPFPIDDEGEYLRRALYVSEGLGVQESQLYDHPYFGQIFLASIFKLIDYPNSLRPSSEDIHSIEMVWLVPRVIMGLLAIADTFLIYKISEHLYGRNIALIASVLFAVMPITSFTRSILLDSIQLPFLLSSVLFALYSKSLRRKAPEEQQRQEIQPLQKQEVIFILLSGIFIGLAIFTKIPAITMIPLVGFLIYAKDNSLIRLKRPIFHFHRRNMKLFGIWFIPVILIPFIWPAYATATGEFNDWINGIYYQANREDQLIFVAIIEVAVRDPVFLILATTGLIYAAIKLDFFILLWNIPYVIFLLVVNYVNTYYLVFLLPISCIAIARLIQYTSNRVSKKRKFQQISPFIIISIIGIFGLITTTLMITSNVTSGLFKATIFVADYIQSKNRSDINNRIDNKITVISNPLPFWIYSYVFNLDYYQKDYSDYPNEPPVKTKNVVLIADPEFEYYRLHGYDPIPEMQKRIQKMYDLYATKSVKVFGNTHKEQVSVHITG